MNIYRVRVRCTSVVPPNFRKKGEARRQVGTPVSYADCLVEALDLDHAGQVGVSFIEGSASPAVRWVGFELTEAARIHLPILI